MVVSQEARCEPPNEADVRGLENKKGVAASETAPCSAPKGRAKRMDIFVWS